MPIESANYLSQLDPANPAAPDLLADTDNHLRMIKQAIRNTFPSLNGPVTATPAQMMGFTPTGGIIMWYGALNAIPAGWALCTGQTVARSDGGGNITTPNLVDKFIKGCKADGSDQHTTGGAQALSGTTSAAGAHSHTGGTNAAGAHNHTGLTTYHALTIGQMPSHNHTMTVGVVGGSSFSFFPGAGTGVNNTYMGTDYAGGNEGHAHGVYTDGSHAHTLSITGVADHTHTVTIADGRPPFFSIAFIMKV